jgi:hypothetical protein
MRAVRPWEGRASCGPIARRRGSVHGVRTWRPALGGGGEIRLASVAMHSQWLSAGKTTWARCGHRREPHPAAAAAPAGGCSCGLYALHPDAFAGSGAYAPVASGRNLDVVGVVEAWGTIHVHREGFRAQYARPAILLLIGAGRDSDYGRFVTDLAIAHRARVVGLEAPAAIAPWCQENGLGMSADEVDALLAGGEPQSASG